MAVRTLSELVFHVREISAARPDLLTVRRGERRESLSATDFLRSIHSLALALEARGIVRGDRVAIYSESRPEWHVVDFACQLLGAPTVPVHPASPARQVGYVVRNSGSRWVFYSDPPKRDVLLELQAAFTSPLQVVAFDSDATIPGGASLVRLLGEGAQRIGDVPIERFRGRVEEDDLASILYTSGTTGDPKGVMLSHRNLVSNFLALAELFALGPGDLALSFVPLAHGFQRTLDHLCLYRGVAIRYVPAGERLSRALRDERPTLVAAVPEIFKRAQGEILDGVRRQSAGRRKLFDWAVAIGRRHGAAARDGFVGPFLALERKLAELLVFRRIQRRFGGRLRYAVAGGGPLAAEVGEFFATVGLPLYPGYGLTETSPVLASSAPEQQRQGSVGKAVAEVEIRVAEDGEILARGPGVMQGYWASPRGTVASFDDAGWLHTGDVGRIDQSGYLFITDRKQNLLLTTGGERVAPQPIERLLTRRGWLSRAVVVGDGHPHLGALLVPDFDQLRQVVGDLDNRELAAHPEVRQRLEEIVAEVNAGLPETRRLRRFKLLERDFTVEDGELTATGKLRRKAITRHWAEDIAELCG